jgi:F-type H+-transporting ATPase subunit b
MPRFAHLIAALAALGLALVAVPASADDHDDKQQELAGEAHHDAHAAHGEHPSHGDEHDQPFNWADGFLGEKDGAEPGLLYRPKGTPPPFLANVINAGLLFYILIAAGKKPVAEALRKRKERLIGAMEEAGRMKADAQATLAQYEEKLRRLDEEVARIRREMREAADLEQKKVLTEARERRVRMEKEAALLVEQERKGARETLIRETVGSALKTAEEILVKQLVEGDKDRLAKDFLSTIKATQITAKGGMS